MPKYKIADLVLDFASFEDKKLNDDFKPYQLPQDDNQTADVNINVSYFDNDKFNGLMPIPQENIIAKQGVCIYTDNGFGLTIFVCDFDVGVVIASISFDTFFKKVDIKLARLNDILDIEPVCFAENIMDIMFQVLIQHYDGFVFHASTILHKGMGVAFSADSGTGKSTHTAIWKKVYKDTVIINDDAPIIRIIDDKPYVYGAPWAGSTGINTNVKAPLRALVFLERADKNSIEEMSTLNVIKRFFAQIRNPVTALNMSNVMMALDRVITISGIYLLKCNMEDDAATTVENYLFNN